MISSFFFFAFSKTSTGSPWARTKSAPESTSSTDVAFFRPRAESDSTICGLWTTCPSVVTSPREAIASSAFLTVIATPKQNPCTDALRISIVALREGFNRIHDLEGKLRQLLARCFPAGRKRQRRSECNVDLRQA